MSDTECRLDRICHEGRCRFVDEVRASLAREAATIPAADTPPDIDGGAANAARDTTDAGAAEAP